MSKINILLITWNRLEYFKQALRCYMDVHKNSIPHTLVIADNGSTDGTREYLQGIEKSLQAENPNIKVKVRYYSKNYGRPRVINHFYRLSDADAEYLGVTCDDVLTSSNWVNLLSDTLDIFPEVGIVGLNDGRVWCPVTKKNGIGVYFGDGFFYNNDIYFMRRCLIDELAKTKRSMTGKEEVYSGYILMNIWGMSEAWYYSEIRDKTPYKLATTEIGMKSYISDKQSDSEMIKHNVVVKRFFIQNTLKYWELTCGLLQWVEDGNACSFPEEPPEEMRCKNAPNDSNTPLCEYMGSTEGKEFSQLFSREELEFWGGKNG